MTMVLYERKRVNCANNIKAHTKWMKVAEYKTKLRLNKELEKRKCNRRLKEYYEYQISEVKWII